MIEEKLEKIPIYTGEESTVFGYNGSCPESPDGKRLCYARLKRLSEERNRPVEGELWVCGTDLERHVKLAEVAVHQHNGAAASWVDNGRIVLEELDSEGVERFSVIDANSGKTLHGPVWAQLGHKAVKGKIPFEISRRHVEKAGAREGQTGIYWLDVETGERKLLVSRKELDCFALQQGYEPLEEGKAVFHVQLSPSAGKVMIRFDMKDVQSVITVDLVSRDFFLMPNKPLHQLWFDEESLLAVNARKKMQRDMCMYRYDFLGNPLELLAGKGNHIDASPDRKWYVSDTGYTKVPVIIHLYRRNETEPAAILDCNEAGGVCWERQVHANPVFSRDGKRVYFVCAVSDSQVQSVYVDISVVLRRGKDG